MSQSLAIIIVEKNGTLKLLNVKDYKEEDLYKKCGFKKSDGFDRQTLWSVKIDGEKYMVAAYAKTDGKANSENKYDFPPPIDSKLFFGSCALVCMSKNSNDELNLVNFTLSLWEKMYEKMFGGFEDLAATAAEDENEEDELENVPAIKKTRDGYLKDGFVVDTDSNEDVDTGDYETEDEEADEEEEEEEEEEELLLEDVGSELSEESYDYDKE